MIRSRLVFRRRDRKKWSTETISIALMKDQEPVYHLELPMEVTRDPDGLYCAVKTHVENMDGSVEFDRMEIVPKYRPNVGA